MFNGAATGGQKVLPAVLRFELIKSHYRQNMNFTAKGLEVSGKEVKRMIDLQQQLEAKTGGVADEVDLSHPILRGFAEALADDLNISGASGNCFTLDQIQSR